MKILVIGSGGRESAIISLLSVSRHKPEIYCAPGNGGISDTAVVVPIEPNDIENLLRFAIDNKIDLTVVGPEVPLSLGIADEFEKSGMRIFAPSKAASLLESSKEFSKDFLKRNNIKTADYKAFTDFNESVEFVKNKKYPLVIKASGLAAGKGVFITKDFAASYAALDSIFNAKIFGESGNTVIIEDYLEGFEVSYMVIVDGTTYKPLITSMDYKKILDGNAGENTGGMGSITPNPFVSKELEQKINKMVIEPTLAGLKKDGVVYKGVLYAGLMINKEDIFVLEFNVRFGDPETQSILIRLKSDIIDLFNAVIDEKLSESEIEFDDCKSICLVLASEGYPGKYRKGVEISFPSLEGDIDRSDQSSFIFHAGTKKIKDKYYTDGGRVVNVCVKGKSEGSIVNTAYKIAESINFDGKYYRKDIGKELI